MPKLTVFFWGGRGKKNSTKNRCQNRPFFGGGGGGGFRSKTHSHLDLDRISRRGMIPRLMECLGSLNRGDINDTPRFVQLMANLPFSKLGASKRHETQPSRTLGQLGQRLGHGAGTAPRKSQQFWFGCFTDDTQAPWMTSVQEWHSGESGVRGSNLQLECAPFLQMRKSVRRQKEDGSRKLCRRSKMSTSVECA